MNPQSVLLVNPRVCSPSSTRLPLAILNLAAVLEGRWPWRVVDGNVEADPVQAALSALQRRPHALVGVSAMPGPQMVAAVEISSAIRRAFPSVPIAWGGHFPTIYPDAAINAPYVDYLIRAQGELTLLELLARLGDAGPPSHLDSAREPAAVGDILGLSWKREGEAVHNPDRPGAPPGSFPPLPYERVDNVAGYLRPSFLGARTAVYHAALGCRYKCEFCGVVTMWNGKTLLEAPDRMAHSLGVLRDRYGADCIQFYDNNFFDWEDTSVPVLEVLGSLEMPYWCFARTDTMARFSASTWEKVRRSRLRMAFFGAEAASDEILKKMKKGARVEHTLEVAARCREYGVVPELSFILGGPEDPEDQIRNDLRLHSKDQGPESGGRDRPSVLQPHAAAGPQGDALAGEREGSLARAPQLRAIGPFAAVDAGGVDRAALAELGLSERCPLAHASPSPSREGRGARSRVPVPYGSGLPHAGPREGRSA